MNRTQLVQQSHKLAEVFKALGHPGRVVIVRELSSGEKCVCDLVQAVGLGWSTVSRYLSVLKAGGVLRCVRVQFAGDKVTDEDELNGIALQGVGRGTVVEYFQVHRNADDGIEFFGGTVNAKYVVLTDVQDDSLDWTQGWQGKIQYGLIKQIQDSTVESDRAFELDNLEQNNDALPRSGGKLANFTVLGKPGTLAINPRRGTGGNFSNFIVIGSGNCLDIDSAATFAAAGPPGNLTGVLTFRSRRPLRRTSVDSSWPPGLRRLFRQGRLDRRFPFARLGLALRLDGVPGRLSRGVPCRRKGALRCAFFFRRAPRRTPAPPRCARA